MKKLIKMGLLSLCIAMFMTVQTLAAATTFDITGKQVGDTVEMSILISDGTANSGEIVVEYDETVLEFVSATKGTTISDTMIIAINEEIGKITVGFADFSKVVTGELLKLTFKTLVAEPQSGYIVNVDCAEWSGEEINSAEEDLAYSNYDIVVKDGETAIINMDQDGDGTPDISVDTDGDGKADINIDTDKDGKADINIDTNGDGTPDVDIDTDGDGKADKNLSDSGSNNDGGNNGAGGSNNSGSTGENNGAGGSNNSGSTGGTGSGEADDEEGDSSEDEDTTGAEGDSGDEGENEGSNNGSTSEPDKDTETNTDVDADNADKKPAVWPFIVGGVVVVAAVVGFFFFKKKSA